MDTELSPRLLSNSDEKNQQTEGRQEATDGVAKTSSDGVAGHTPVPSGEKGSLLGHSKVPDSDEGPKNQWKPLETCSRGLSARHTLAFLAFLGFFNAYSMRVNLSVALVAMVMTRNSSNTTADSTECPAENSGNATTSSSQGEFDWDESTQGLVLGAFFYGYITTQLPGGWLGEKIGGKRLLGYGVLASSVLTLLTPVAARLHVGALVALRVLEGVGQGVIYPAIYCMWATWAPVMERSSLITFSISGAELGVIAATPLSGVLSEYGFAGGWPSVFYVFGTLGCLWVLLWMLLVYDHPHQHPRISAQERHYIETSIGVRQRLATPWKSMFTSPAVWAICVAHFANNWGFYSLMTCLPLYMKRILKLDLQQSGSLSGLPYVVLWIVVVMSGFIADFIRGRQYMSTGGTRKLLTGIGMPAPGILLLGASYAGCNHVIVVTLMTLGLGLGGLCAGGVLCNYMDIAPRFAGTLFGIGNIVATIPGFLAPQVVGALTNGNDTMERWRIFFFITAGVYAMGTIIFLAFSQGEELPWSRTAAIVYKVEATEKPQKIRGAIEEEGDREKFIHSVCKDHSSCEAAL